MNKLKETFEWLWRRRSEKTAIIHIGPPKTGSTAIQYYCTSNKERLKKNKILYPLRHWHAELGSYFSDDPLSFVYNKQKGRMSLDEIVEEGKNYFEKLDSEIDSSNPRILILSYEGFFSLTPAALKELRAYLLRKGFSPKVLFYCRDPLSFAPSSASQAARMGVQTGLEEGLPPQRLPALKYADIIPNFVKTFGRQNVIARRFERASLVDGDIVADFFYAAGAKAAGRLSDGSKEMQANTALSGNAIRVAQEIRSQTDALYTIGEFQGRFESLLIQVPGKPLSLTEAQAERVLSIAAPHGEYLREEFGIELGKASAPSKGASLMEDSDARELCGAEIRELAVSAIGIADTAVEMASTLEALAQRNQAYAQLVGEIFH